MNDKINEISVQELAQRLKEEGPEYGIELKEKSLIIRSKENCFQLTIEGEEILIKNLQSSTILEAIELAQKLKEITRKFLSANKITIEIF